RAVDRDQIPCLSLALFREELVKVCKGGKRVVSFFGLPPEKGNTKEGWLLYAIMADDERSELCVTSTRFYGEERYLSLTKDCPSFHMFEREFYEISGIRPEGHPWLKPVRYDSRRSDPLQTMENYPFYEMAGEEVHQVAVGPVHAGIIEPGHFRFMCHGERVHHLEIQLGYQHRGVEYLMQTGRVHGNPSCNIHLAESIAGDSVIAHATACAQALESLGSIEISMRPAMIRALALEMERIAVHIGDLGAIANDIAYLTGNAVFGANRTLIINTLLSICGSRFGHGLIRMGGVGFDIDNELKDNINKIFSTTRDKVVLMGETMLSSAGVLGRLEKTGTIDRDTAGEIGMVGMAARASGVSLDIRADHPWGAYKTLPVHKFCMDSGDVFARTYIRFIEIQKSFDLVRDMLENLPVGTVMMPVSTLPALMKNSLVVSMVEGWRGEIVHTAITDEDGDICRYKIKDPSFNNWYGLALAVRDNGVSDFPLVNKSFNLSYCGNDL
ncbi:MAG: NADH-quinone oxidoreductase subunit C, partial [Acidobacteria bacterium]|nr:NADH-quinone oxidoreductase subunit C [Acidobacteriota bacterium]